MKQKLVSARELEVLGILKRRTALRMAVIGLIPHYKFGERMHRVGFIPDEVMQALRRGDRPTINHDRDNSGGAA